MDTPWARVGSLFTRAFEDEVAWFLQHTDRTATAKYFGVGWETVGRIAERVAAEKLDPSLLKNLLNIGVDEICYGRPLKYLTVVVNHETGRVVWSGPGQSSATLGRFFDGLGASARAAIKVVTMDMDVAFEKAVREHVPNAEIVYDR
jgi:transposase